jgi:hypothetical protein
MSVAAIIAALAATVVTLTAPTGFHAEATNSEAAAAGSSARATRVPA